MPAFGCNSICCNFVRKVLYERNKGFRLSDRIVSALDRFIGALTRFIVPGQPGVMTRWLFIYPFVGGTDWTHSLNLADVGGDFEKFGITWSGNVTHSALGVTFAGGQGNTNCDMSDTINNLAAWNRRSQGFYCRTNVAAADRTIAAGFVEPKNGYSYSTGIHARWTDGNCYGDLVSYSKAGVTTVPNRNQAAVSDSLGLFSDNQRGTGNPFHYMYKRGVFIAGENTPEVGMGYGDGLGLAMMIISGPRNISFVFSTKHPRVLEGGAGMPGGNPEFNYFVEQLQVGLARAV